MIVPIGEWVLREACRQAARWNTRRERSLSVSVNLSAVQLDKAADLPGVVASALQESGLPATSLVIELTESLLVDHRESTLQQLQEIRGLGVRLAIDDFGTGYSSLAYLRRFPVDTLKIDRSFVERLGLQNDDAALASTIVQLGQSLGMSTVAEGIEDYGQLAALREMGCTFAQGFYFSRPVPAGEAGRLLLDTAPAAH